MWPVYRYAPITRLSLWAGVAAVAALFGWGAWQRRWIADDGLIVLRTVRNLMAGNGPVFNAGERVESNTSTLWTYLTYLGGWIGGPLRLEYVALTLALSLSVLGVVFLMLGAARLYAPSLAGRRALLLPAGALVYIAIPPARDFATSGLENGLVLAYLGLLWWLLVCWSQALRTAGARGVAGPNAVGREFTAALAALAGISVLVRPELALVGGGGVPAQTPLLLAVDAEIGKHDGAPEAHARGAVAPRPRGAAVLPAAQHEVRAEQLDDADPLALLEPRAALDRRERRRQRLPKPFFIGDVMVRRKNRHHRLRITLPQHLRSQTNARRGVAASRLHQDVVDGQHRQTAPQLGHLLRRRNDQGSLDRDHAGGPSCRRANQRLSAGQHRQKLLGTAATTMRPQPRPTTARQDHNIGMIIRHQRTPSRRARSPNVESPRRIHAPPRASTASRIASIEDAITAASSD